MGGVVLKCKDIRNYLQNVPDFTLPAIFWPSQNACVWLVHAQMVTERFERWYGCLMVFVLMFDCYWNGWLVGCCNGLLLDWLIVRVVGGRYGRLLVLLGGLVVVGMVGCCW